MVEIQGRILHIQSKNDARHELQKTGVDPCGVNMMIPKTRSYCIKLTSLKCHQANILKQEMLSVGGDAAVARGSVACSIPYTDVILIGTEKQILNCCNKLKRQPFGLKSISAAVSSLIHYESSPPSIWNTSRRQIKLNKPLIMGILNVTPDSFSDGSRYLDPALAIERGLEMIEQGADIIDIGGESTRPGAHAVSVSDELARIIPVIKGLADRISIPISVDTWKHQVAKEALDAGAEIVNDISGFNFDQKMGATVSESGAAAVLMHTRGTPENMQKRTDYNDLLGEIFESLNNSVSIAINSGIPSSKIVIDPGIGFAKTAEQNLEILRRLSEFSSLGLPILLGTSRKSFIGKSLGRETDERLYGTAATVALAVASGVNILRVHDVKEMRDVADMAYAITHSNMNTSKTQTSE